MKGLLPLRNMSIMTKEKRLAEAVAVLVEEIHQSFPNVSTRPISPYAAQTSIPDSTTFTNSSA